RPHIRAHETGSPLRFMNGGDAELCEGVDDLERSAVDVAYGYVLQVGISHLRTARSRLGAGRAGNTNGADSIRDARPEAGRVPGGPAGARKPPGVKLPQHSVHASGRRVSAPR